MKTLALLATLFVSFNAQATSLITSQTEILPNVEINGEKTNHTAIVNIDFQGNTIKAEIFDDICNSLTAQPGVITCMAMPRHVTTIEAPLTEKGSSCGSAIYKGFRDDTIVDGLRVDILVSDHNDRMCRDIVRSAFEVEASTFNPWTQTTTNYYLSK